MYNVIHCVFRSGLVWSGLVWSGLGRVLYFLEELVNASQSKYVIYSSLLSDTRTVE